MTGDDIIKQKKNYISFIRFMHIFPQWYILMFVWYNTTVILEVKLLFMILILWVRHSFFMHFINNVSIKARNKYFVHSKKTKINVYAETFARISYFYILVVTRKFLFGVCFNFDSLLKWHKKVKVWEEGKRGVVSL